MALIVGNACCFRFRRVAKRNGGGLVGAVCLVGVFAKETISVDWCIRECTPLGVLGLVGRTRGRVSQAVRSAGNIGYGILIMRRCLLLMANLLRTGVRQGLKRKWTAVCVVLTPLGPPKGGNYLRAVAGDAGHCSGKPDGAAAL